MMSTTQRRWLHDFTNVCEAIERANLVVHFDGGFAGVVGDPDTDPLIRIYDTLRSVGYARGWL